MPSPDLQDSSLSRTRYLLLAGLIGLIAFLLREQFILLAQVDVPIRGDVRQYVAYAYNLAHSGIFSAVDPGSGPVHPDSFRGPGYPIVLAATMLAAPENDAWYGLALHTQALLGTGTVLLVIALGRLWLSRAASLTAGLLIAIWPHHIAATGALLSEVLFGFMLAVAALLAAKSERNGRAISGLAAGLAYGYAYLINPLIMFFAPLLALAIWKRNRTTALALLLIPTLVAAAWSVRNASLPDGASPGRASINLVQGSWPEMHVATAFRFRDPAAVRILESIDAEAGLLSSDPAKGLKVIGHRLSADPWHYTRWYLVQKPWLLWDWDIRIGYGDVYALEVARSPLDTNPILSGMKTLLNRLNFTIFLLSGAAALVIAWRFWLGRSHQFAPALVASLCIYVTLLHMIFQAEPRYSTAYRPFQMLMLVTAISFALSWLDGRRAKARDWLRAP